VKQNRIAIRQSSVISYGNPTIAGQLLGGRVAERSGYFDIHACRWQAYNDLSMVAPTSANDSLFNKSEFVALRRQMWYNVENFRQRRNA